MEAESGGLGLGGVVAAMEAQATATVKDALAALYHHPDHSIRTAADRWLQEFQHTLDAWQVHVRACFSIRFAAPWCPELGEGWFVCPGYSGSERLRIWVGA